MWRLLYLLQLAPATGVDAPLLHVLPPSCGRGAADEIVVCKGKPGADRLGPRLPDPTPLLPDADFRLFGNVTGTMRGEQRGVGGFTAPAGMVSVKIPF